MSDLADFKQKLISRAVQENVDVMVGRYRFRRPDPAHRVANASRIFFFLTLPIAIFGTSYLASAVADSWIDLRSTEVAASVVGQAQRASGVGLPIDSFDGTQIATASATGAAAVPPLPSSAPAQIDRHLYPLGVRKIILDPGHGGENKGATAPGGLDEKSIALDISQRVSELLGEAEFEVALTREEDLFLELEDRASFANTNDGDLFVSIHLNWIETREIRGIETYYLGPTEDPYLNELAARENRDAGYSMADFRKMLDRVYADVRQDESRQLARAVQRSLYSSLRRVNPGLQNRGVKKAPFIVLTGTEMPAILAEVSCLSNAKEARLLMTPEYRQYIAEALFRGIESYARELNDRV